MLPTFFDLFFCVFFFAFFCFEKVIPSNCLGIMGRWWIWEWDNYRIYQWERKNYVLFCANTIIFFFIKGGLLRESDFFHHSFETYFIIIINLSKNVSLKTCGWKYDVYLNAYILHMVECRNIRNILKSAKGHYSEMI